MSGQHALGRASDAPSKARQLLERWRGNHVEYELAPYLETLDRINALEEGMRGESLDGLHNRARSLRPSRRDDAFADARLAEVFAIVREVSRRELGMRHFDVQLVAGIALHQGRLVEMQTGEGKTLAAVAPAILVALGGTRVHILTFNDYLARRDMRWMEPLYRAFGVSVSHVGAGMSTDERRGSYAADVTYVTAKEAGFDYLRDGLCFDPAERVHCDHQFAIVDEADSILIDEARIPLVIAGSRESEPHNATRMAAIARDLELLVDYETDEQGRNIFLTDRGTRRVEDELGCGPLHDIENTQWLTEINLAIHAKELLSRDVDYIVRDGVVELVDEFTGRVVTDRHWPDGLQTAIEAKEGLRFRDEGAVLGSITMQHYFHLYDRLAGMTATARPNEREFGQFYGLTVLVLPTNEPCVRDDLPDRVFTHRDAKTLALVEEIEQANRVGRPVLVGTASVRESEELAATLRKHGITCDVLNAKTDDLEARIIADAGAPGAVTISTNMAGRGTDIRLGGRDECDRDRVAAAGGLYVIGTNRHESRRIDRQLRGRAGRQGDPGQSRFFVSLEDDVIERYGVAKLFPARHRERRVGPIDDPLVARRIDWAQRRIEGQNFDIRQTLWHYSAVIEQQRAVVRGMRDDTLTLSSGSPRWREARPGRYAEFVAACGPAAAVDLEREASLHTIERVWAEHLRAITEVRESIHLVRLGNQDPLSEFLRRANDAFNEMLVTVDEQIVGVFDRLEFADGAPDLEQLGIRGPSSTWTYLVDDNPFKDSLQLHVGGNVALSLGAAMQMPWFVAVALYRRFVGKRRA